MKRNGHWSLTLLGSGLAVAVACGGGGGGGGSTPAAPTTSGGGGAPAATVRITATGVSLQEVRIDLGGQVMFVNEDTRSHEMLSDPHPVHTNCPEVNQVGDLGPGQSRMTAPFRTAKSCGFHDNLRDDVTSLRGRILVGGVTDPGPGY